MHAPSRQLEFEVDTLIATLGYHSLGCDKFVPI